MAEDYSKLSDEELIRLASKPAPVADYSKMSDEQLISIANAHAQEKGMLQQAGEAVLGGVAKVGKAYDSVFGAPTRAAIGAIQEGQGLSGAVSRYLSQFGEDPTRADDPSSPWGRRAPTGAEIVDKTGVGLSKVGPSLRIPVMPGQVTLAEGAKPINSVDMELPSARDAAGFVVDVAADPTNILPVSKMLGAAGRGVGKVAELAKGMTETAVAPIKELAAAKAAKTVIEGGKSAFDKLLNPTISPDWAEYQAIAEKNGIDPKLLAEEHEFGSPSLIARASREQRAGVLGEPSFKKFTEGLNQTRDAVDRKVAEIGGGERLDPVSAGEFIRKGYDEAYHAFFDGIETSYDTVIKDYPGLALSPNAETKLNSALNGVEKFAKGRVARGVTQTMRSQGEGLINAVAAIREGNGSVKQTVEALRDIGEAAFTSKNSLAAIPPDVAKLRKLYFDVTDALHTTIREDVKDGTALSDALKQANARMSEWFGEKSIVADSIGNKAMAPEKVFNSLVLSGDTRKIQALSFILGPDRMQKVKGAALGDLVARSEGKNGLEFGTLRNSIKSKRNVLGELLDPQEAADFSDLVRLGEGFGNPVLSSSETQGAQQMSKLAKGIPDTLVRQTALEGLKKRAREGAKAAETSAVPAKAAISSPEMGKVAELKRVLSIPVGSNRTIGDILLKGAATYSQTKNDEETRKLDAMKRRAGDK